MTVSLLGDLKDAMMLKCTNVNFIEGNEKGGFRENE